MSIYFTKSTIKNVNVAYNEVLLARIVIWIVNLFQKVDIIFAKRMLPLNIEAHNSFGTTDY
jgi:hypothetical protein